MCTGKFIDFRNELPVLPIGQGTKYGTDGMERRSSIVLIGTLTMKDPEEIRDRGKEITTKKGRAIEDCSGVTSSIYELNKSEQLSTRRTNGIELRGCSYR